MEHEKQIREQIRQQIGLTQSPWKMSGTGPFRTPTKSLATAIGVDTEQPVMNTLGCTTFETEEAGTPLRSTFHRGGRRCCRPKHRIKIMNLRVTVPLRGVISQSEAVLILLLNIFLPGIGTAILGCFLQAKHFQRVTPQENDEEVLRSAKVKLRRYRKRALTLGILQFLFFPIFLAGWLWAIFLSIQIFRDARTYGGT